MAHGISILLPALFVSAGSALGADFDFTPKMSLTPGSSRYTDSKSDVATDGTHWGVAWESFLTGVQRPDVHFKFALGQTLANGQIGWDRGSFGPIQGVASDPIFAASRSGTWVAAWSFDRYPASGSSNDHVIVFSRSEDGGVHWSMPEQLATPDSSYPVSLATDGAGTWIIAWHRYRPGPGPGQGQAIVMLRSTNDGVTWPSTPVRLSAPGTFLNSPPQVATDERGNWLVTWIAESDSDRRIEGVRSTNHGVDWSQPERWLDLVPTPTPTHIHLNRPRIASDGCQTWILTWSDCEGEESCEPAVHTSTSRTVGAWWSAPRVLPDSRTENDIAADHLGNWAVAWTKPHGGVMAARSSDGGASWTDVTVVDDYADHYGVSLASNRSGRWMVTWTDVVGYPPPDDANVVFSLTEIAPPEPGFCWKFVWVRTPSGRYVLRKRRIACADDHCSVEGTELPSWWTGPARRIYREWLGLPSRSNFASIRSFVHGFAEKLASAPAGVALNDERRVSLDRELHAAALDGDSERTELIVQESVNAIELDRLGLQPSRQRVKAGSAVPVGFGRLGRATLHRVDRGGNLSARVAPGVPAASEGYAPGFPMATYQLEFNGALAAGADIELEFPLWHASYSRPLKSLRLLEWDGARYRDITREVDARRGLIRGRTDRLASYVIMQEGFENTEDPQPSCPWWRRIVGSCGEAPESS